MPFFPEPPQADAVAPRGTKAWRQAVKAHQDWIANELWSAQAKNNLNLSDPNAMKAALAGLGIEDVVGGGRHAYNMFTGNLPSEGFGMSSFRDIPYALEAFMPDWKFNLDRAIQAGTPRAEANAQFMPAGFTNPGSASYTQPPVQAGAGATAQFAAPAAGPSVPGLGSTEGAGGAGVPIGPDDDDDLMRRLGLSRRRPGQTLSSLSRWG